MDYIGKKIEGNIPYVSCIVFNFSSFKSTLFLFQICISPISCVFLLCLIPDAAAGSQAIRTRVDDCRESRSVFCYSK